MATKSDPNEPVNRGMLDEAVDALLQGMDKLYERFKGEVDSLRSEMNTRFDNLEAKVNQTKNELKDEINGLKADLSTTPSRREFEELKTRVDKRYPLS